MKKPVEMLLRLYAVVAGLVFGLFLGLLVLGSILRVAIEVLFGYGESGPTWVIVLIVGATTLIVVACVRTSSKWVNGYIEKKKFGSAEGGKGREW